MIKKIKGFFIRETESKNDFSEFFLNAPSRDKKKLLLEVVREANKDQKDLVEKYNIKDFEKGLEKLSLN